MPISLGAPTTNPKWNKPFLILLWIAQLLIILFLQFWTASLVLALGATGLHKHLPWIFTATVVLMLILQLLILTTILYEFSYTSRLAYLTASRFLKIQAAKSLYFVFFVLVVTISRSGFQVGGKESGSGLGYVWAVCWRLAVIVGPFWGTLGYAAVMKGKAVPESVEFEYTDRPSSRGQRYESGL
ncbi:uncharacterized protein PAC_06060 [Phialocephala subalpina]|uniref:Uncharacterized protein n=1 Tax=Phialocephala subalpina TaxID=576137 RepID=A0A1L7WTT6_9HELO|nr:uncharacterized protein PAC_06060 [Phialocephala subalpina]